ncbi:MAG: WhiB family transcriptional regulator [Actinomycetota bacterium]
MTSIDERIINQTADLSVTIDQLNTTDETWRAEAACQEIDGARDLFFSEELQDIAAAKQVCITCPVIAECLEGAVARAEPCGVWGGQLFLNGRILTTKRRRGRPPKNPRPEDQLPVVPVPERFQKLIA